jgi:hypothetical protein
MVRVRRGTRGKMVRVRRDTRGKMVRVSRGTRGKMVRVRRGTRGNVMLRVNDALCVRENEGRNRDALFNIYDFSTTTMATLVRLIVTLYVHALLC